MLLLHKLEDGSFVKTFPLDMGSITGYSGRRKDTEIFYSFTSFLTPGIIYHCDMTGEDLKPSVRSKRCLCWINTACQISIPYFVGSSKIKNINLTSKNSK